MDMKSKMVQDTQVLSFFKVNLHDFYQWWILCDDKDRKEIQIRNLSLSDELLK